jgi:hypothetical protein
MGTHSTDRKSRHSEIEEAGEGTVLYFKFLKYWMWVFFGAALLSGPAATVFVYGMEYDELKFPFWVPLAKTYMGNMGSF